MTSWQKRARIAVALFGLAVGAAVLLTMRERSPVAAPGPVERLDPKAVLETTAGALQRVQGRERDFEVTFESSLLYEDNSTRYTGVRITPRNRAGREFVVRAREARAEQGQRLLHLNGEVRLTASDGFELVTETATFNQDDGIARAPGAVQFTKGQMRGSGADVSYDTNTDVLTMSRDARVATGGADGGALLEFTSGAATLDRPAHRLALQHAVRVVRNGQQFDSDNAVAHLSDDNSVVRFIELRGRSSVSGGSGSLERMRAQDIDLDYTDDGATLEQVVLAGSATLALAGAAGAGGREMAGDRLELTLAPDGAVTRAIGTDRVRLALPAHEGAPLRTIEAQRLDATGAPGAGLTSARFSGAVVYREGEGARPSRTVRADMLEASLSGDTVTRAVFTGRTSFDEEGLTARASSLVYQPQAGTLELGGRDSGGDPRISDGRIAIEAQRIEVTLAGRRMVGHGTVRTTLQPPPARGAGRRAAPDDRRLPGVFSQEQSATVTAAGLEYDGDSGRAIYTGGVTMVQGVNAIRADRLEIDLRSGDLLAAGDARSHLALGAEEFTARSHAIRFDDAKRRMTYTAAAATGPAGVRTPAAGWSEFKGPSGDLRARRIEVALTGEANQVEALEAYTDVTLVLGARTATAARLAYLAADQRYELTGTAAQPVTLVDRTPPECRETTGRMLTFYRSTDRILVDGLGEARTASYTRPCAAAR